MSAYQFKPKDCPAGFQPYFEKWFLGDVDAITFAQSLWSAAQAWDDHVDGESHDQANDVLHWMSFGRLQDPFFRLHQAHLRPAIHMMFLAWRVSNVLEKESAKGCEIAVVLRALIYQVFLLMADLIGGPEHSSNVGPEIWRSYGETTHTLKMEFGHA